MTTFGSLEAGFRGDWFGGGTGPFGGGAGFSESERKVSGCLSGTFVCAGGCGMQCGVQ